MVPVKFSTLLWKITVLIYHNELRQQIKHLVQKISIMGRHAHNDNLKG